MNMIVGINLDWTDQREVVIFSLTVLIYYITNVIK